MKTRITLSCLRFIFILLVCIATDARAGSPRWSWFHDYAPGGYFAGAQDIKTDRFGNMYMVGQFKGRTMVLGADTLINPDHTGFTFAGFMAKLDSTGTVLWTLPFGSTSNQGGIDHLAIDVDSNGTTYLTGVFLNNHPFSIGTRTLYPTNNNNSILFMALINPNGTVGWTIQTHATTNSNIGITYNHIKLDRSDNTYLAFTSRGAPFLIFGFDTLRLPVSQAYAICLVKLDWNGNYLWGKSFAVDSFTSRVSGLCLDTSNNIIYSGVLIPFYSDTIPLSLTIDTVRVFNHSKVKTGFILAKFSPAGRCRWVKPYGSKAQSGSFTNNLTLDRQQNMLVTDGYYSDTAYFGNTLLTGNTNSYGRPFLAKYDKNGGLIWTRDIPRANGAGTRIAVDEQNNYYLTGVFADSILKVNSIKFRTHISPPYGGDDNGFVIKYNNAGQALWGNSFGPALFGYSLPFSFAFHNSVYVAGNNSRVSYFDTLISYNPIFIGRLGSAFTVSVGGTSPTCSALCSGSLQAAISDNSGPVSYRWSPGGYTTDSLSNLCAGTYTCVATDSAGHVDSATFVLTVNTSSPITLSQSASICPGDSFIFAGHIYKTAGTYTDTSVLASGCDSIVTLHLSIKTTAHDTITQSICSGDSFAFGGSYYRANGYYSQRLTGANGCDSFVTLHLSIKALSYDTITQSICSGDSFAFGGSYYRANGYYSQRLTGANGCDSFVTLHLSIKALSYDTITQSICSGDSFAFGGSYYRANGYYSQRLTGVNGCDSVATLHLTVKAVSRDTISQGICSGDSLSFGGNHYSAAGYYSQILTGVNGCDSISTLHLTVNQPNGSTIYQNICEGDSFPFAGSYYHTSGFRTHIYTGVTGCDSLVILDLTVMPLSYDTISLSICAGDSAHFGANYYRANGYYSQTLTGVNGCDSFATLHLTVKAVSRDTVSQSICSGDSVHFGSTYYHSSGYYSHRYNAFNGCDSFATLHLTVKAIAHDTISQGICGGDSISFGGNTYHIADYYSLRGTGSNGCDSFTVLHLTVNPLPAKPGIIRSGTTLASSSAAAHYQWLRNGGSIAGANTNTITVTQNGAYALVVTDANGCSNTSDTMLFVHLSISDIAADTYIRLYPNPNNGSFTLETAERIGEEYVVYDMLGQIVQSHTITTDAQRIDMGDVVSGIYSLVVKGKNGSVRFTVIR